MIQKLRKVMGFFTGLALIGAAVFLVAALLAAAAQVIIFTKNYVSPPPGIYIQSVEWDGAANQKMLIAARQRFGQWGRASSRLSEASKAMFVPERLDRAESALKDLNITVAGLAFSDVITMIQKVFPSPYRMVTLQGETADGMNQIVARLNLKGRPKQSWTISEPAGATEEHKRALIDSAILEILFDLHTADGKTLENLPNHHAFKSYIRGTEYFRLYLRGRDPGALSKAIDHLRDLVWEVPDHTDGKELLASSLAEQRREEESIEILDELIGSHDPTASYAEDATLDEKIQTLKLKLNRAQAQFFLYDEEPTDKAFEELLNVRSLLQAEKDKPKIKGDKPIPDVDLLLALANAQLADVIGHLLIYVGRGKNVNQYILRALNRLEGVEVDETDWKGFILAVEKAQNSFIASANAAESDLISMHKAAGETNAGELAMIRRLLSSAKGYRIYHQARLTVDDQSEFADQCRLALAELKTAYEHQPQEYTVLQNIGTVYADPYFDNNDRQLKIALAYFEQSLALTPDDYWGHLQRSKLLGRRLMKQPANEELLNKLVESSERAFQLRPWDAALINLRARVAMWQWSLGTTAEKTEFEERIGKLLSRAQSDPHELEDAWVNVVLSTHKLRVHSPAGKNDAEKQANYDVEKAKTIKAIDYTIGLLKKSAYLESDEKVKLARLEKIRKVVDESKLVTATRIPLIF